MSEPTNESDPLHPHERDGRDEKPVIDKDGRCLVCCRDYGDARIAALEARVRERTESLDAALTSRAQMESDLAAARVTIGELVGALRLCVDWADGDLSARTKRCFSEAAALVARLGAE